nr:TIGR01906 family membrane protein [Arthrobacter sp. 35/47]
MDDGAPTASGDPTRNDDDATVTSPDADNPASTRVDQPADRPEPAGTRADTGPTDHVTTDPQPATSHIAATTAGASTTADPTSPATSQIAATPDNDELAGTSAPDEAPSRGNGIGTETGTGAGTGAAAARETTQDETPSRGTGTGTGTGAGTGAAAAAGIAAGATASAATKAKATRNRTTPADDPNPDTSSLSIRPPEEDVSRRANQRDEAAAAKPVLPRVLQVMVAVFFPVILLAAAVRAVTTPLFLWVEYHRPGFPADSYGFSTEDRMTYGSYTMDYILNWAPARYLGDLVNVDGDQLFLDSEVGHMADVKGVLATGFVVATVLALLAVAACIYLARKYPGGIRRALFAGATATLVLAIALAVAGILAWETFFTQVHALFFADGTWTFRLDDTLIRLFPAQFWIDAAAAVGAIVLIGSVLTLVLTWPTKARREKSARAYEARRANSGV